ncbi:site-specific integrase [Azospirillum sp. TSH64]|uniref:tyrosine-type recombinase/integrase n=1 Tax=Azospirillum sp. TSH64 TaxID=652740 RepID=UPI000D617D77|nr:site-specific integrase [Azospirillum sp. TSH64]PWC81234.1 hypothetical protein TSH64_00890 [Azospirillum sp. TSH64]
MATVKKIEWTNRDGSKSSAWQVRYIDQSGKRRAKNFDRKKDAEDYRVETEGAVKAGTHVHDRDSVTIEEAATVWLGAVEIGRNGRPPAEEGTLKQYRNHVSRHIVPRIGALRLNRLTTPRVVEYRDELLRDGVSRAMTKKVLTSLVGILSEARTRGLVAINAAEGVTISTSGRHETSVEIPTKDEVRDLVRRAAAWSVGDHGANRNGVGLGKASPKGRPSELEAIRLNRHRWFLLLLKCSILTGARISELRGLPWGSVDLEEGAIEIVQRADEKGTIGPTKTKGSRRRIVIPDDLRIELKSWRIACPKGPLDLVFPNGSGKVESLSNIANRFWYPLQVEAKVVGEDGKARYGIHALRHFRASVLIESRADIKEVQRELGHSSAQITLDTYGHLFDDAEANARRKKRTEGIASALFG